MSMTENEKTISVLKHTKNIVNGHIEEALDIAIQAIEEIQQYRAIGTVDECRTAVERMKPKEPIIIDNRLNEVEWKCPVCGLNVIEEPPYQEYCQRCGNKLDWSE